MRQELSIRENAIFFPTINVPNNEWFTRVLLYWDKVNSIVPTDYVLNPERFAPHMKEYVRLGLVEQIMPSYYIWRIPEFADSFLNYVRREIQRREFSSGYEPIYSGRFHLIHAEKMEDIAEELVRLNLADRQSDHWYGVEEWVARAFMTYLAAVLGNLEEINAAPVTNDNISLELLSGEQVIHNYRHQQFAKQYLRSIIIDQILPCPQGLQGYSDSFMIAEFKENNHKQLINFRNYIEGNLIDICNIGDVEQRDERLRRFLAESKNTVEEIIDAMKKRWKQITFGALIPVMGAALALSQNDNPVSRLSALTGLAGAVYQALQSQADYKERLSRPLAYAALAERFFRSE